MALVRISGVVEWQRSDEATVLFARKALASAA